MIIQNLGRLLAAVGWSAAVAIGLAVVYGLVPLLDPSKVPTINAPTRVIYGAFHRCAWAIAVAWVIFASVQGYGGIIYIPIDHHLECVKSQKKKKSLVC